MPFGSYSSTPSANTSIAGNNIGPGGPPGAIDNAIRQLMADARQFSDSVPATQVILAAATQGVYPNAAGAYVPRGLTQASVGAITPGGGGTSGTFDLTWTGGNFTVNPTGTFTVTGGVLASVNITGPGQYIGLAANPPTPGFGASLGLSGAAVVLTAQALVGSGVGYWVVRTGGEWLDRYVNNSGVALATPAVSSLYLGDLSGVNSVANVLGSVLSVADNMPAVLAAPAAADRAQRWAEGPSAPGDGETMSAKSWALDAKATRNSFPNYFKGDTGTPGINGGVGSSAGSAGLFAAANGMAVGAGITRLQLSGSDEAGLGGPQVIYDAAVTTTTRDANPLTQFIAADGRGFKLDPNQRLSPAMFGAGTGKAGAQNDVALVAAAELKPVGGAHSPAEKLGVGVFNISQTLEPNSVFSLSGHSSGYTPLSAGQGDAATHLVAPANTTVIRIRCGSIGDGDTIGAPLINAGGSTIEGLRIRNSGTSLDAHGIHARGTPAIRDIQTDVAGDGINITATSPAYDPSAPAMIRGNANHFSIMHPWITAGGHGICVGNYKGNNGAADVNAGAVFHPLIFGAGLCGIYDQAFYANTYYSPHLNGYNAKQLGHCWYNGFTWQLITRTNVGTVPGSDATTWYKLRALAAPDSYWLAWDAGKTYRAGLPMLGFGGTVAVTPYQEGEELAAHLPGGLVIGGNMQVTQKTPKIGGSIYGLACNMGVGHWRSATSDHPAFPSIGAMEYTFVGAPGFEAETHQRAKILSHMVADNGFEIGYRNSLTGGAQNDVYAQQGNIEGGGPFLFSISGQGTARTYGRTAPVVGMFSLHDHAIIDATDGNNARVHGMRAAGPASSYHARGEFYWNVNPGAAGGVLGWATTASGTPGTQTPVRIYDQLPAQADLASDATLATVITAHNALLAKLRASGLMVPA